ncbi:hypothetical protein ZHAS_00022190 [Anopheles sinensis]|uniref:Uncharacterized protein n=1 Tax=Anopheles sinensis TaxID=74873 RepID=A0A084WUQ0_ANOSI|nr:hypothetical protein ZHAS_00022190 [Anopheles sinensis]
MENRAYIGDSGGYGATLPMGYMQTNGHQAHRDGHGYTVDCQKIASKIIQQ